MLLFYHIDSIYVATGDGTQKGHPSVWDARVRLSCGLCQDMLRYKYGGLCLRSLSHGRRLATERDFLLRQLRFLALPAKDGLVALHEIAACLVGRDAA